MPLTSQPKGLLRFLLRLPIRLYRGGWGWIFGQRAIYFQHRGRVTGKQRETVLEVVTVHPELGEYVVAAAWAHASDWLRNVEADPHVQVKVGRKSFPALAARLTEEQAAKDLLDYARAHPIAFPLLMRYARGEWFRATEADCRRLAATLPMVAFRPLESPAAGAAPSGSD